MLRAGVIGFPAVGKTTLFQLMTSAADHTGGHRRSDADVGLSRVPDVRLDRLTELFTPRTQVPATVEFVDMLGRTGVGGLLDAAAVRQSDALLHVVRMFRDDTVPHPSGSVDPARDARTMEAELILADLSVVERRLAKLSRDLKKKKDEDLQREQGILARCHDALEGGTPLRVLDLDADTSTRLRGFQFLSAKPLLVVVNLDESDLPDGLHSPGGGDLATFLRGSKSLSVAVCAKIELEIGQLGTDDAQVFMSDLGLAESGLDRVIRASYDLLGYISFFTIGEHECRAWSIPRGTPAQHAAHEIHSDMARGFIRAEVVSYDDLLSRGSLHGCREHGEVRLEGKGYVVRDGDVINFRFAT